MSVQKFVRSGKVEKWLRIMIVAAVMISITFIGAVAPARAEGAIQIAGIGYPDITGECNDAEGSGADFATILDGDLVGCQYVFVESYDCSPGGTYREEGTEVYVIDGPFGQGTFSTTYFFRGKFEGCSPGGGFVGAEIMGFCQHPIVAGSGSGDYEGVTGRLHFQDDVVAGNYPYTGHLKW
jgi:hypothetical protein